MKIMEAAENYLETIYMESQKREHVRAIDICNALGYAKPTVSVAMKSFRENGYINTDEHGSITLTEKGLEIALKMYDRHNTIAEFFMSIGVDRETAFHDSCKIEHDISEQTFACIKEHLNKG